MSPYDQLIAEACAEVDSSVLHPCNLTPACQEASGCPTCISGLMRGDLGIVSVTLLKNGTVRITTVGHDGKPCTIALRGIHVTVE